MGKFQNRQIWQNAKKLTVYIFTVSNYGRFARDFDLKEQIRRSALTVSRSVAEGEELGTDKKALDLFIMARSSITEIIAQTIIANEIGYINDEIVNRIEEECAVISGMLSQLIEARQK